MMKDKKILIVGCGDIGIPLALKLESAGASVWGLRRDVTELSWPIKPLQADVTKPETLECLRNKNFDYVVITLTPASFSDDAYQIIYVQGLINIITALNRDSFNGLVIFVSSTRVYHQDDGQWVDETSPTLPTSFSGRRLLEAESELNCSHIESIIVRFAGIYGPGRRRLIDQVRAQQGCAEKPAVYTNRIHRDDCVGFLYHLIDCHHNQCNQAQSLDPLYLGVDSMPVTLWELKHWLAKQMGLSINSSSNDISRTRSSKRCNNQNMLATGYQLQYSDFKSGYQALLENEH